LNLPPDYDAKFQNLEEVKSGASQGKDSFASFSSVGEQEEDSLNERQLYCAGVPGLVFGHCHKVHNTLVNAVTETIKTKDGTVRVKAHCHQDMEPCESEPKCVFNVPGMVFTGDSLEKVCKHGKKQRMKVAVPMEEVFQEPISANTALTLGTQYPSLSKVTVAAAVQTGEPNRTLYMMHPAMTDIKFDHPSDSTNDTSYEQGTLTSTAFDLTSDVDSNHSRQVLTVKSLIFVWVLFSRGC
jgi:hypothetical protein